MSFFTSSSGIIINGGHFTSISLPTQDDAGGRTQVLGKRKDRDSCESVDYAQANDLRKRRRCRSLDGLMIVKANEVNLHRELIKGIGYRIHSASHHGRLVAVKTFEGPSAKQDWTIDVAFSKEFLHSNVLKIEGVSDDRSKSHFVLFRGITSEHKMQSLIAKALRTDLNLSVQISMKAVKGIAAGLSYIKSQNIPMYPGTMNNIQNWENFNIFTGYDDEPIISFHPSSTVLENGSVSQTFDDEINNEINSRDVEVLSRVCQQLFSRANSILYDDSPEREFDVYRREGSPRAPLEDTEGTSSVSEIEDDSNSSNPSNSLEKPKYSRSPRREVWWLDLGVKNLSLESIKRRFEDYLDRFLSSSSNSPLRHITSPMDSRLRHNLHQCPGYLREEITLVSDASKSVIVSHAFPSQSEVCSICGQLVQYEFTEPSIVNVEMQEALDDHIREHTDNDRRSSKKHEILTKSLQKMERTLDTLLRSIGNPETASGMVSRTPSPAPQAVTVRALPADSRSPPGSPKLHSLPDHPLNPLTQSLRKMERTLDIVLRSIGNPGTASGMVSRSPSPTPQAVQAPLADSQSSPASSTFRPQQSNQQSGSPKLHSLPNHSVNPLGPLAEDSLANSRAQAVNQSGTSKKHEILTQSLQKMEQKLDTFLLSIGNPGIASGMVSRTHSPTTQESDLLIFGEIEWENYIASVLPPADPSIHLQVSSTLPLSSNISDEILLPPAVPGPSQPHLHSQFPQFAPPPYFGPYPFLAANSNEPYSWTYPYPHPSY